MDSGEVVPQVRQPPRQDGALVAASLTYSHLESLGLVQAVGRCEDMVLAQDGAPTEALILLVHQEGLGRGRTGHSVRLNRTQERPA